MGLSIEPDSDGRGQVRKRALLAVNLIIRARLVAKSSEASVDADRILFGLLLPIHVRNVHSPFALAKTPLHAAPTCGD